MLRLQRTQRTIGSNEKAFPEQNGQMDKTRKDLCSPKSKLIQTSFWCIGFIRSIQSYS